MTDPKIIWKKVLTVRDEKEILTAYVFGPLMKLEQQQLGHLQVRSTYIDHNGHKYSSQASLEAHMTKL
jgi:hypothetical protein